MTGARRRPAASSFQLQRDVLQLTSALYEKGYWIVDLLGRESVAQFFERADSGAVEFVDNVSGAKGSSQRTQRGFLLPRHH